MVQLIIRLELSSYICPLGLAGNNSLLRLEGGRHFLLLCYEFVYLHLDQNQCSIKLI
jgi:hypothetical protein